MSGNRVLSRQRCLVLAMATLFVLLVVAITADVVLAVLLCSSNNEERTPKNETKDGTVKYENKVCLTTDCTTLASRILQSMNTSANPCDNFYHFSCGGWLQQNVLLRDLKSMTIADVMQNEALLKLKRLLEADVLPAEPGYIKKAKYYYASCVNQVQDTRGYIPLLDLIKTEFGGWPLADGQWNESSFDAEAMVAKASRHSVSTICTFSVIVDFRDGKSSVLKLDQPKFILGERQEALNTQKVQVYRQIMADIASRLGINNATATASDIEDVLAFETNLSMIAAVRPYGVNNPFAISRMQERYLSPAFDWKKFFVIVTSAPDIGITNLTDDEIIFRGPNAYFVNLKTLLLQTTKRTLANFIIWRAILTYKQILDFTNRESNRYRVVTMLSDNEMLCLESMAFYENMKYATNGLYVQSTLDTGDKVKIADMFQRIQAAFNKSIDELDWMQTNEKQTLKEKNGDVKMKFSYWEKNYNESVLDNYYYNMTFDPRTYFENVVKLNKESFNVMVRQIRVANDPNNLWDLLPILVNAYYDVSTNSLELPEALFQPPIYNKDYPAFVNYGGIGTKIAHELTHGFDSYGINYDKDGVSGFQWNQPFIDNFNDRKSCLINQYNSFYVWEANRTIDGTTTFNENIADNSGVKLSYKAFKEVDESSSTSSPLPGINYTQDQLFFISYAQSRCTLIKKDEVLKQLSGIYSPQQYRVLGPLQNSIDFVKAFSCPVGSFMNPAVKCNVY